MYITLVAATGLCLVAALVWFRGLDFSVELVVLSVLVFVMSFPRVVVTETKVHLSLLSIIMTAATALLTPSEVALVGLIGGYFQVANVKARFRVFNATQTAIYGTAGAAVFSAFGGERFAESGTMNLAVHVGLPLLMSNATQLAINLLLLTGLLRASDGVPMRVQAARILRATGPGYLGFGVIAFLMVVLWRSAGLGPASVMLVFAPLLVAQWANVQLGEEVRGQGGALQVLVAAIETKAPHLAGHSARVADLSARIAGRLGLRAQSVADARMAGMLHDLGQTTLATALVRGRVPGADAEIAGYPERGARLLGDLDFLSGSLEAIAKHRIAIHHNGHSSLEGLQLAEVVGMADEYDLLTAVGEPDGTVLSHAVAVRNLRELGLDDEFIDALEWARPRRPNRDE
ncbi:MAG: HD-GYP domain-containing protein [Nocardioides sp.]